MPHADKSTRTTTGARACPYCGRPLRGNAVTCSYHRDLPALEPLDDRYQVRLESGDGGTV